MTTKQERQELKRKMPRAHLSLFHTENCRVLPNRNELLHRLPRQGMVAEIGAAFGDYTREILDRNGPKRLYLIDLWESERYRQGLDKINEEFRTQIDSGKLEICRGYSTEVLAKFDDDFFDWVYIDTNHSFGTTWKELTLCNAKVKPNGRIAGHDFCTGNVVDPVPYGVVEACCKFCRDHDWQFEYLTTEWHGHFSFCLKRL